MDHEEVNSALAGAGIDASELHGFLCGVFCLGIEVQSDTWYRTLEEYLPESGQLTGLASEIGLKISTALKDTQMQFNLLLPDADAAIDQRTLCLSLWCSGFVSGYGLGSPEGFRQVDEVKELLVDFRAISRLNEQVEESDENESDLMQLEEYVRMGTIFLYDNLSGEKGNS